MDDQGARMSLAADSGASVSLSSDVEVVGNILPDYDGPYEVTPSGAAQVLQTADRSLRDSIIVHPIPSNYGLITWNGSTLMVS